ncbi:MAG: hypothetical protein EXS09_08500 [Gemmataceae bacterium]|nr:hypothetical protein [Gemmataceae bacterium]
MFNRIKWTAVLALAILPLMGCANRRLCQQNSYSARPVIVAAPCNSCPNPSGPPAIIIGG